MKYERNKLVRKKTPKCFKISWIAWVFTVSTIIKSFAKGAFLSIINFGSLLIFRIGQILKPNGEEIECDWICSETTGLDYFRDQVKSGASSEIRNPNDCYLYTAPYGIRTKWLPRIRTPTLPFDHFRAPDWIRLKDAKRPRCNNFCGRAKQRGVLKIITHGFGTGFVILNLFLLYQNFQWMTPDIHSKF